MLSLFSKPQRDPHECPACAGGYSVIEDLIERPWSGEQICLAGMLCDAHKGLLHRQTVIANCTVCRGGDTEIERLLAIRDGDVFAAQLNQVCEGCLNRLSRRLRVPVWRPPQ